MRERKPPPAINTGGAGTDIADSPRIGGRGAILFGRGGLIFLLLLLALLASMTVAAGLGSVHYPPGTVLAALRHGPNGTAPPDIILWGLRLPRILLATLVGASLAAAGVAFQSLLGNDLADPYIVGVSAGASVGAEAVLLSAGGAMQLVGFGVPLAAFGSALVAMVTVYLLARRGGRVQVTSLLLAGVVVSAFLGGVSTLMLQLGPPQDTMHILGRLLGSLQDATLAQSGILAAFLVAGLLALLVEARAMNLFSLGEESAQQLGVETERFKTILIVTGSLLTAATVAFAGIIGFVGLMVPHMARRLAGTPDARRVLPLSALGGALLMVWADTLARTVMPDGRELPVGIITAFLGAPFFCYLLRRQ